MNTIPSKNFCRLCFEAPTNCFSLFENQGAEMLESLTSIKINPTDKISVFICSQCFQDLKAAYNIRQKIIKAEARHQEELLDNFLTESHDELKNPFLHHKFEGHQLEKAISEETSQKTLNSTGADFPGEFICEVCSEMFQFLGDFRKHTFSGHSFEIHESDILCEKCGDVFSSIETHNTHMKKVHTGEYICDTCGKDFFQVNELHQHEVNHFNVKSFICDICNQAFSLRYVLQVHKLQHNNDYAYSCQFCDRRFKHGCTLKVHQKSKHGVELSAGTHKNLE